MAAGAAAVVGGYKMHEDALVLLLKKLSHDVDLILHDLNSGSISGAINWGDLGCAEASYSINDQGAKLYNVLIEEAAPDNAELCAVVYRRLIQRGWPDNVAVSCEW